MILASITLWLSWKWWSNIELESGTSEPETSE